MVVTENREKPTDARELDNLKSLEKLGFYSRNQETGEFNINPDNHADDRWVFAQAGIDIRAISSEQQYIDAWKASIPYRLKNLERLAKKGKPSLERDALIAIATGNKEMYERTLAKLEKRNRIALTVVNSGPGPPGKV
jgi:hypothetical protein